MAVTSKDIARELKLSQPTVSRILSGDPNHRASFATRERVLQAAEQLGYRPNAIARSLRRGRTDVIGLYNGRMATGSEDAHATVVTALRRQCAKRRLDLLLYSSVDGQPASEMLAKVNDGRVDGLIVYGGTDDPLVEIAGRSAIPVAAIVDPVPHLFSVTFDDISAMEALVSHYWWRGYRQFMFVGPDIVTSSSQRLHSAFEHEMDCRGICPDRRLVRHASAVDFALVVGELAQIDGRMAVCCWNDVVAYNLRLACLAELIDVHDQVAIGGFGGFLPRSLSAGVLSVRCDWDEAARAALDWVLERVNNKKLLTDLRNEVRMPLTLMDAA